MIIKTNIKLEFQQFKRACKHLASSINRATHFTSVQDSGRICSVYKQSRHELLQYFFYLFMVVLSHWNCRQDIHFLLTNGLKKVSQQNYKDLRVRGFFHGLLTVSSEVYTDVMCVRPGIKFPWMFYQCSYLHGSTIL